MAKSIFQHLFDGDINPSEIIGTKSAELKEIYGRLEVEKPDFLEKLPANMHEDLESMDELTDKAHGIYSQECFAYVVKLGLILLFEALSDKDSLLSRG